MQKIQSFDWLHFKLKFKFQMFKFKTASTPSYYFVLLLFYCKRYFLKLINIFVFILVDAFGFQVFWFHKDREITKTLFTMAENNFGERKLWRNFSCGNETGSPGRVVSLHPARSGSQSERRIRRILPARGACHIINMYIGI